MVWRVCRNDHVICRDLSLSLTYNKWSLLTVKTQQLDSEAEICAMFFNKLAESTQQQKNKELLFPIFKATHPRETLFT